MEMDFYPNDIATEDKPVPDTASVRVRVEAVGGDSAGLAGRYSQRFVDEMARQLTSEIEAACGIEGLADSSVELLMVFAPNTYMEHISDNVTYRRLMLVDKVSAPRDFWIRWTRLDGAVAYSVSDDVTADSIRFELGEDVDQKIREREYRYLTAAGKEKYHNSMGRKKVTEWREVIKRAVKRGEITKLESDFELAPETLELEERIADLLGKRLAPKDEPVKEEIPYVHSDESEFEKAIARMRMVVEESGEAEEAQSEECRAQSEEEPEEQESPEDDEIIFEKLTPPEAEDDEIELEELEIEEDELEEIDEPRVEAISLFDVAEEPEKITNSEFEIRNEENDAVEDGASTSRIEETDTAEEAQSEKEPLIFEEIAPQVTERVVATPIADRAADIRAELETKIRLEYEIKARAKAEAELINLRREYQRLKEESDALLAEARMEQERLRLEYQRLVEYTENANTLREAEEAQRRAEEEQLRAQIEMQLRQEARERERLAEAARMAIEEQHRLEAENARIARQREEEERIEAEARRKEQEARELEALRQAELERIRREDEEAKARARAAMPEMGDGRYSYTSKSVKLLFRRSVDPNITTRIYEIIKATVEYYGKDRVYLKIKAIVPDSQTVVLEFEHIPIEEMELLGNIIKILGNSGLGIAKAIIE